MREREFYPQPVRLPQGWPGCAFVFLWGLGFGSAVLMAPLGIGIVFGLIGWGAALAVVAAGVRMLAGSRRGIAIADDGLAEVFWLKPARRVGWDLVTAVHPKPGGARIETQAGAIEIGESMPGWPRLVRRIEQMLGRAAAQARATGAPVPSEEIEGWLGVPSGGRLRCAPAQWIGAGLVLVPIWLAVTFGLVLFYGTFIRGALQAEGGMKLGMLLFTLAHASIFFGVFSGGLGAVVYRNLFAAAARHVEADAFGLRVMDRQGRRFVDWGELRQCTMRDGRWHVVGEDDQFSFEPSDRNAPRLLRAVKHAVAAHEAGRVLPEVGEVTDAAISLARETGEPEAIERGLSVAEEQGDTA